MYVKRIPRELAVIADEDPCNPVDGFFFIWTSMTRLDTIIKGAWQKASMEKQEDEATNGDGVVTMKAHEKKM